MASSTPPQNANGIKSLQLASNTAEFKSFSGANIYATIGHRRVATLQAVTVSITREVAALYSFGDANPKSFVRGKRGIAGTLVFTMYDRHSLLRDVFREAYGTSLGDSNSMFSSRFVSPGAAGTGLTSPTAVATRNFSVTQQSGAFGSGQNSFGRALIADNIAPEIQQELSTLYDMVKSTKLTYSDQIPEFDINITMINENGDASFCVIGGVLLVNEGWGYTLDDLTSESAFTYVAKAITPLTPINDNAPYSPDFA